MKPAAPTNSRRLHPLSVRVMHWINAVAMIIMIGSGWHIYNDEAIFGSLHFPHALIIGGDHDRSVELHGNGGYSGALQWHFLGMWLIGLNGVAYLIYGFASGRFRRMLLPIHPREVLAEIGKALRFRLKHDDITRYNAVQRVLYAGILLVGVIQVLAGLAIWKPVQFSWLVALFYDFQGARLVHFFGMAAIVLFLIVHVALALLVPKTLVAMLTGGPRVDARTNPQAGE